MITRAVTVTLALLTAMLLLAGVSVAQTAADSGAADAFGVKAVVSPVQQEPIRVGPVPQVNAYAPGGESSTSDSVAEVGSIPDDGALVEHVRAIRVVGEVDLGTSTATATAETAAANLFGGQVTADVLKAVSTTTCPGPGDAVTASEGSEVVGLNIGGQEIPVTPEPNQVAIRLADETGQGIADIRVFEVIPDADGNGWTTRMLHIFTLDPVTQVVNGEIIVAEAHTSLTCGGNEQTSGPDNEIFIEKGVTPTTAQPGDTVTYDITITNQGEQNCTVHEVIDRLPVGFEFVSSSGTLADVEPTIDGREVRWSNPAGWPLEPDATLTGVLVAEIGEDVGPGTYANNVIVRSTCGLFNKGLDAPVTVGGGPGGPTGPSSGGPISNGPPPNVPSGSGGGFLPATGGGSLMGLFGLLSLGGALLLRRRLA